ncbi:phage baseplate assembly protein V [Enterobacter asburiae]|uniref:phage baseplate assembly protein V n=1 Tax=Enterobacter asburiae TaxID=61645 RepID=UPI003F56271E
MEKNISTAELLRRLCNLIRPGIVTDINGKFARVSTGDNTTTWIRWAADRAGDTRTWLAPSVGEQVFILSPDGEPRNAFIAGSLYCDAHDAPGSGADYHMTCPDGAEFIYSPDSSSLHVSGIKTLTISASGEVTVNCAAATIKADEQITLDAPEVKCTNKLTTASFSATEGGEMHGNFTGTATFNDVRPDDHDHGGVKSGDDRTKGTK